MPQRKAIKRPVEIVAECPLGGVCTQKMDGSTDWISCGHYNGTITDKKGFRVVCKLEK